MKILISPALQMDLDSDLLAPVSLPLFADRSQEILDKLRTLSYEELGRVLKTSDKLLSQAYESYRSMPSLDLTSPALLAYQGIQYKSMGSKVFTDREYAYLQSNLRILSGFFGILKPFDAICWHRLEMKSPLSLKGYKDLYAYWGSDLAQALEKESRVFINLASEEYAKSVASYLSVQSRFIRVRFEEVIGEKRVEKGVYVKMARGQMVRFMAEMGIDRVESLKTFDRMGFKFDQARSKDDLYVFSRPGKETNHTKGRKRQE